uniref:Osteocrin n=1 Tax=Haplochromis burtoni TaxID=8153 RepID=A0A3Q2X9C2_HAPBU
FSLCLHLCAHFVVALLHLLTLLCVSWWEFCLFLPLFCSTPQSRPVGVKVGEELTAKLLQSDHLMRMENDVMEPKRKRSFPINNVPLDRLSISSMETKQQGKVVESPRRRLNPPPIDRIGMGRLPNGRG